MNVFVISSSPDKVISRDYAKQAEVGLIACGVQGLNAVERYTLESICQYIISSSYNGLVVHQLSNTKE
ncbi:hypothetical protein [Planococcus kocurii]|uniref:hypothetical protein n=1 Tax=Planococcus kocurii TaxID=1374 RepID=UPI000A3DC1AE|nr:hypothetical protein [Planococcus kocurii]